MSPDAPPWEARISLRAEPPSLAEWLERSLAPEASREVPRARARVHASGPGALEVEIDAADGGAMRAALNTYLGWIDLSVGTARVATARPAGVLGDR